MTTPTRDDEPVGAGKPMIVMKELEGCDGEPPRTIGFTDMEVEPLGYDALSTARLHQPLTIPLHWRNATVVDTDIPGLDRSQRYSARALLESPFTARAIGLVKGGWLPSMFAATHERTTILVDRNIVSEIIGRFDGGRRTGREPDFLDLFADYPIRLNPMLYVLEGSQRALPTPDEVDAQLEKVERQLGAALPQAQIVVGSGSRVGTLGLIEDMREATARKQAFLQRLAPTLAAPVGKAKRQARWAETLVAADACGVPRNSLIVLSVLSALAVPNGGSPARALLKFKTGYSAEDAYNAVADLRALEMLAMCLGLYPDEPVQLCTADRALALLWVGIQAHGFRRVESSVTYEMSPVDKLIPPESGIDWRPAIAPSSE